MEINEILDRVLIARCMYTRGLTYLSDAEYDEYCRLLKENGVTLSAIYEDDDTPYDSFSRVMGKTAAEVDALLAGSRDEEESTFEPATTADLDFLNESKSLSITSVTTFQEAFSWFQQYIGVEMIISTKIDGVNTRRGYSYKDGKLHYRASLTRGRRSDPIDITRNMKRISPDNIVTSEIQEDIVIYSETTVPAETLSVINAKYDTTYTVPRGLAMALMRVSKFEEDDYLNMRSFVFRIDYGKTLEEGLDLAERLGFDTVPYTTYTYNGESYDQFKVDMEALIAMLKKATDDMDIVTDGMVAEVNSRTMYGASDISNSCSSANLALKIGLWQPGVYESTVKALDFTMQADRCACVAVVEPVIANGGQKISRVNCFNPSVLFDNGILPGTKIHFEYKNETTVNIIL